jgi:hypothetical protein
MRTTTNAFHSMRGHVTNGCEVIAPSGKVYTLRNHINGWMFYDSSNTAVSGYLPSAYDVEYYVFNALSQS